MAASCGRNRGGSCPNFLIIILMNLFCLSLSETVIDITVEGAIKTGVGRYAAPVGRMLELTCHLRQFPTARLWILRNNDQILLERTFTKPGLTEVTYQITGDTLRTTTGNYTCRFYRTITRRESHPVHFSTENTVEITAFNRNGLPRCDSSRGVTGLPGETTTVFCGTHDGHTAPGIVWRGLDTRTEEYGSYNFHFTDIPLDNQPSDISCGYFVSTVDRGREWEEFCSLPPIAVSTHMELTMEPSEFGDEGETVRFTCQSDPPSDLIRWSVFGHNQNIIGDYYTTKLQGEFRANVTQGFGRSILEMSSSSIRTDGVHLVTCSATRENYRIAVSQYSWSLPHDPTTTVGGVPSKGKDGTARYASSPTGVYSSNTSRGGRNAGFITVIVLLVMIVVILAVATIWMYRNYRKIAENNNSMGYPRNAEGLSVAQRSATYEPLNRPPSTAAPPAYRDLDVGYSTMGPPSLDDPQYMEPCVSPSKDSRMA